MKACLDFSESSSARVTDTCSLDETIPPFNTVTLRLFAGVTFPNF